VEKGVGFAILMNRFNNLLIFNGLQLTRTVLCTLLGCKPALAYVVVSPSIVICMGGNLATADL
jgi:hypothetical protein